MSHSSLIAKGIQLKISRGLILFLFVCCEMFLPLKGWAQSFSDTGVFSFTGSHNPIRQGAQFREFLPGEGLKAGPVQLHPFLGVAEVFTDNVFRTKKSRKSGFLTTIAPGFQALLPFGGRHSMLLDYRAAQFLYTKFSENNALAQDGLGHLILDFPGGLKIDFQGNHVEGFDPRGSEIDSQQRDVTKWYARSFRSQAALKRRNLGISLGVNYRGLHFKNNGQNEARDRKNLSGNLILSVPTRFASALLGFNVSDQNYEQNNQLDSFSYGVFTGFRLAPSRQLSGEFNVGYSILNFDEAPVGSGTNKGMELQNKGLSLGGKQQKAFFMSGDLRWRPTSRSTIRLSPFRSIRQSAVFNTSTFIQTGVRLRGDHRFNNQFRIDGSFRYSNNEFEEGRSDNRFRLRTGLEYRTVKWLGFKLTYSFAQRASNQSRFDFYSNTIMLSVQGFM